MSTEAQKKASAKYDAKNTKLIQLKLNLKTDVDILKQLELVGNKQGYIKELIRKHIAEIEKCSRNIIIDGEFKENEYITVRVDGIIYQRKVRLEKDNLCITIKRKDYTPNDF